MATFDIINSFGLIGVPVHYTKETYSDGGAFHIGDLHCWVSWALGYSHDDKAYFQFCVDHQLKFTFKYEKVNGTNAISHYQTQRKPNSLWSNLCFEQVEKNIFNIVIRLTHMFPNEFVNFDLVLLARHFQAGGISISSEPVPRLPRASKTRAIEVIQAKTNNNVVCRYRSVVRKPRLHKGRKVRLAGAQPM